MKFTSRKLCVILLSAAVILTGCTKKPRPTPADTTAMGSGAGSALTPTPVGTFDQSAGTLQPRTDGVIEDADTIRNLLPSVYFDFDKSAIKQGERQKIADASDYLKKNPQYRMLLEGHCDWRGTAEYNLGLGDRRGQAVKQFLQNLGIQMDKLQILSKGSLGAAEKGSDEQMAKDRRVDFVILKK
ncbi:MAG TPA: OmpA family protein [Opitutaceae bacterium]|nr:OmpA family protein [Opitutaceae bacterium]